jgi:uncharacterized protein YprB with RNaseH-like and TPR domain
VKADLSLYERLRRLGAKRSEEKRAEGMPCALTSGADPSAESVPALPAAHGLIPAGWRRTAEHVFTRSFSLPNPYPDCEPTPLFYQGKHAVPPRLCFYDTETTGLSGGAGNVVFLLGLGRMSGETLEIEQYFLADYPGERDFLALLAARLDPDTTYVSYNGSAFDRHVLRTRFIMHGMQNDLPHQLDLLFPVRRLWKKHIGSCSLHNVEEQILSIKRTRDIPGADVPLAYFDFLKSGDSGLIDVVFEHNKQDVLSLVHLYFKLQEVFSVPGRARDLDAAALGTILLEQGHPQAAGFLRKSFEDGQPLCGRALSLVLKRQGRLTEAVEIWRELFTRYGSMFAGLELAKFWEHQKRDYPNALRITEKLLAQSGRPETGGYAARPGREHRGTFSPRGPGRPRGRFSPTGTGSSADAEYAHARADLLHRAERLRAKISRLKYRS